MNSFDSVKRGSGSTVIGKSSATVIASTPPIPTLNRLSTVIGGRPAIVAPVPQLTQVIAPPNPQVHPLNPISSFVPTPIEIIPEPIQISESHLIANTQELRVETEAISAVPSQVSTEVEPSPAKHLNLTTIGQNARSAFIQSRVAEITDGDLLREYVAPTSTQQLTSYLAPQTSTKKAKSRTNKFNRIPIYFAVFALFATSLSAGGTWFQKNKTESAHATTLSKQVPASKITIATYQAKNTLDPDKKAATNFVKGDPAQICIGYENQPNGTLIQIKILREVDGGSQLEVISAKLSVVGTDTRCLPFTGAQASVGTYNVQINSAPDITGMFTFVTSAKFIIAEAK